MAPTKNKSRKHPKKKGHLAKDMENMGKSTWLLNATFLSCQI